MIAMRPVAQRLWCTLRVLLLLAASLFAGHQAGDWHWPYNVRSIEVEPQTVHAGDTVDIVTVRDFFDDCTLFLSRQLESVERPVYSPVMLPDETVPTPWEDNGKPRSVRFQLPADVPCGAAQLRTSPSAACNLFQLYVWRMRQGDRLTPFDVACR